jgi:hypothetical protein
LTGRFHDLELACVRVPNPIASEEDACTATDFIAQCQAHIKRAEVAHKREKELFLKAGRAVDSFFKRPCDALNAALAPTVFRLEAYRDAVTLAERRRRMLFASAQRILHHRPPMRPGCTPGGLSGAVKLLGATSVIAYPNSLGGEESETHKSADATPRHPVGSCDNR